MQNISIIIPAKNEAKTIEKVIKKTKQYSKDIIVIDGHSKDQTKEIVNKNKARFYLDHKKGKGEALRYAVTKAKCDIIVFIDADLSHEPEDIPLLIKPIIDKEADMVIGSRIKGGSDEFKGSFEKVFRTVASHIITLSINIRWGKNISDSQNGFRAIKKEVFEKINLRSNGFQIEQEMVMKCFKNKYLVKEIPSHEYERTEGKSQINLWKEGPKYIWSLIKNIF